ncbi:MULTISPECIES: energy transducer TonB [unclassified Proteiniphilum]|jgi:TonB family protein|uniref:energy transducer TonB n=1 Tax=Proteiniphilum sp. UBA7639 TaxID=1947289 RepID=UPI00257A818D|nr:MULTISPECIES: energy transducer TonB [unclassified Proteiniphilum]
MNLRKILLLAALFILAGSATVAHTCLMAQEPPISKSDRIFEDPDIIPMFTGGSGEMNRFIFNTLKYPPEAVERNAQGLVVYTFVVEKDGTLSNFNIIHRADSLLNKEALRILEAMPPWRPARHRGEIVRAETYVPMYFRLNKNAIAASKASKTTVTRNYAKTDRSIMENNDIYTIVDKMPQYSYGESGLGAFISHNIRYPREARQEGIEGRILCSFIVGADGSISNIEVEEGLDPSLDSEAVRVLGLMPKWIPGENGGEKVNVKCLLPIDFTIDEDPIPPFTKSE